MATAQVAHPVPVDMKATLIFVDPDSILGGGSILYGESYARKAEDGEQVPADKPRTIKTNYSLSTISGVNIRDARPILDSFSLDKEGFVRLDCSQYDFPCPDSLEDFQVPETYIAGTRKSLLELTGARHVWFVGATCREAGSTSRATGRPAGTVHSDYTLEEAKRHIESVAGEKAAALLEGRLQQINVWKPLRGPIRDYPLALCDAQSLDRECMRRLNSKSNFAEGIESWSMTFSKAQRWYYMPDQMPHEAWVFKNADSLDDRTVPHSAFDNRHNSNVVVKRASVEIRAFVIY